MASYIRKNNLSLRLSHVLRTFGRNRRNQDSGVKGDPDHPAAKGLICRKMRHYEKSVHSPERILIPMKRVGAKGEEGLYHDLMMR